MSYKEGNLDGNFISYINLTGMQILYYRLYYIVFLIAL